MDKKIDAVNSAVAKMFAKVSVEQVVDKLVNKVNKTKEKQGTTCILGNISIKVSEDYKIKIDYEVAGYIYSIDYKLYEKDAKGKYWECEGYYISSIKETNLCEVLQKYICKYIEWCLSHYEEQIIKYENRKDMEYVRTKNIESWNYLTGLDYLVFNNVA